MFDLADSWVWDYWFADDGTRYHLFFLYASRALKDPAARHYRASIGHAVSSDLDSWTRVADALVHSDPPRFDDAATWTGSIVRDPTGEWRMYYTGATMSTDGRNVQSIGCAVSPDLMTWTKLAGPLLSADPRWYEILATSQWQDEAFRDPWVFQDPSADGWHMLITARANHGPILGRGVIGHAWSPDLDTWELREPLTQPTDTGFGQLEVMQAEVVEGHPVLLFSCLAEHATQSHRTTTGGTWAAPAVSLLGPFDIDAAYPLTDASLYVGRLFQRRDGEWVFFAFNNVGDHETFGGIIGPLPITWDNERLRVLGIDEISPS